MARFCRLIITPLAAQMASEKNMLSMFFAPGAVSGSMQLQRGMMFRNLVYILMRSLPYHSIDKPVSDIINSIKALLGYGIDASPAILPMYQAVRLFVLEKCYWFESARKAMVPMVLPLVKPMVSDENGISDIKGIPAFKSAQYVCNELFVLSLWLTEVSSDVEAKANFYLSQLARDLFTVPVMSALFNSDTLVALADWNLKFGLMGRYITTFLSYECV